MRILADQDVYILTIDKLKGWGHNVVTVKELGMQTASDDEILHAARDTNCLFLTRDKDFGELIFLKEEIANGVILLRGTLKKIEMIHSTLQKLLQKYAEDELKCFFCVVEPSRYRIRHLKKEEKVK
jgi:predicted nuclease of predicted toxin-antitoxin system